MSRILQATRWLWATLWPLYAVTVAAANITGAVAALVFISVLIPITTDSSGTGAPVIGMIGIPVIVLSFFVGAAVSLVMLLPVFRWQRHPDDETRKMIRNKVMRIPVYQAGISAAIWTIVSVCMAVFAMIIDGLGLGLVTGTTGILAGFIVTVLTYLAAQRLLRPLAIEALSRRFEDSTLEPPIQQRITVAWTATTGAPGMGIMGLIAGHYSGFFADTDMDSLLPAIIGLVVMALVTGLAATLLVTMSVVDPIMDLKRAIGNVRRGETDARVDIYDGNEIGVLQAGFNELMRGMRSRQKVRDLFGHYVGAEVARRALEERPVLGGEDRDVAVLFVDVVGSTTFAVNHSPEHVVEALNAFFERVVEVVHRHKGIINKFEGDAALAVFGAPLPLSDASGQALAAARELKQELKGMELACGMGVAAGTVVAGHIGGHDRFEYTVIGDAVNTAARLTELAKMTPDRILTNASTLQEADERERSHWTMLKSVELRGRHQMTQLARPIRPTLADRS